MGKSKSYTKDEEEKIKADIKKMKKAKREAELAEEARNRFLNEQRKLPGFKY